MARSQRSTEIQCPFCGQSEELFVDLGRGEAQTYVEDCSVCCHPRVVHIEPGDVPGVAGHSGPGSPVARVVDRLESLRSEVSFDPEPSTQLGSTPQSLRVHLTIALH